MEIVNNLFDILAGGAISASKSDTLRWLATSWWLLSNIFRSLFFFFDSVIYYLIPEVYKLILKLADIRGALNQEETVKNVTDNIYIFFSLAMFFRYAFAILMMIADPDKIEDKQQGLGKIVTNSIIAIILTVAMPTIFSFAFYAQGILIGNDEKPGAIASIFNTSTANGSGVAFDAGTDIAKKTFNIFVEPLTEEYEGPESEKGEISQKWSDYVKDPQFNVGPISETINYNKNYKYAIGYLWGLSTAVGLFLLWNFITMAIEVVIRSLKLFALQMISPIAIISYIDPSSASKGIFKKWTDECMRTYMSLFFRLFVMTFLVSIINLDIFDELIDMGIWVFLFFILGLVSFIKVIPKVFEDIFGYKSSDDSKLGRQLLGAATAGVVGGAVGAAVAGGYAAASGAPIGRVLTGAGRGLKGGMKSAGKAGYSGSLGKTLKAPISGIGGGVKELKGSKPYKDYSEAHKKFVEDRKAKEEYATYSGYVDQAVSSLSESTRRRAGESRTDYSARMAGFNFPGFDSSLFGSMSPDEQTNYIKAVAKKSANSRTYGEGSEITKAKNDKIDADIKDRLNSRFLSEANDEIRKKEIEYQSILDHGKPEDIKAAKEELNKRIVERNELSRDVAKNKESLEKAGKQESALLESPKYKKEAEKSKRIDRGKNIS